MSEKYPALDDEQINASTENIDETDFLKREADVLGDEFKTEQDTNLLADDADEFGAESTNAPVGNVADNDDDDEFSTMQSSATEPVASIETSQNSLSNPNAEKTINEWKDRTEKEITERDATLEKDKAQLQEDAVKHIDDFYETYNTKKQQQIDSTRKDEEDFLKKRDEYFAQDNTTWDRVLQLINQDDANVVGGRDRTKFKEILQRLKGKTDAPGA
ncbi:similar to Saccharomyces cerevisiae YGR167W CLC1 Clathrin light chain, subunit of the major coat protein involved in intracellular protein transport and endocytosis [Maudiozyma barnettii]|uniref:Clathrin light chain n=1 Tax=Maudiozyma barnettii TaxID=61262 RepID=A0A8H2VHF9_9SACH|nr:Clc1p [Kazachstania barnettii]CAB4255284.1 similar to Saccharomyces cerevisiae YGR167W CLC1 Clathrin light chain, subunit of the major coat protein involved in intracellular protein transport and endocytosis [Kazachstania barnettii]CAD1783691.1 similar to Saccharomyces cerevisiae YGR167W CLC1 Clathrin light chain, subunit of the major coat protein involved in intracellular protein transport and endocytosis [Kazachstania barnettii]